MQKFTANITSEDWRGFELHSDYRYSFNGMEKDDEITGVQGSHLDFGARIYDSRVGRWLSRDPKENDNASWSTYCYVLDNPLLFVDIKGEWPGITFFFFEAEAGVGLSYGVNYIRQSGYAEDEVGETHFIMQSTVYVDPQVSGDIMIGAQLTATYNIKQSWRAETFKGYLDQTTNENDGTFSIGAALGFAASLTVGWEEFSLGVGVGVGVGITVTSTQLVESISLAQGESEKANDMADGADTWSLGEKSQTVNEQGYFTAVVYVPSTSQGTKSTGITVYSKPGKDGASNGVWMSASYYNSANFAEENYE